MFKEKVITIEQREGFGGVLIVNVVGNLGTNYRDSGGIEQLRQLGQYFRRETPTRPMIIDLSRFKYDGGDLVSSFLIPILAVWPREHRCIVATGHTAASIRSLQNACHWPAPYFIFDSIDKAVAFLNANRGQVTHDE